MQHRGRGHRHVVNDSRKSLLPSLSQFTDLLIFHNAKTASWALFFPKLEVRIRRDYTALRYSLFIRLKNFLGPTCELEKDFFFN